MPYIKEVFDVVTFEQAKDVVLTPDSNNKQKFEKETKFTIDTIADNVTLNSDSVVLDFGCGMGRISKELISRFNCKVIGLDISPSMLTFARLYTANMNKFLPTHEYTTTESVDMAISILALQHSEDPKKEIDNIVNILKPNGIFVLLNESQRFVPDGLDAQRYVIWNDDGFDVFGYTESKLKEFARIRYISGNHDIIFYRKEV